MTSKNPHLEELGKFLMARRSELNPADLGLPGGEPGTRRVSGLRREEVAANPRMKDYYDDWESMAHRRRTTAHASHREPSRPAPGTARW